jgi:class 3 adenylate cyclase
MTTGAATRRLAAILAADVAGYSRLMGADEEGTQERLKAHLREVIEPKIREHHGRIVKIAGDDVLADLASVVDAVRCAGETQRAMAERDLDLAEERRLRFRIGINLGDVIADGDDIYGDGVNIAARLEGLAAPGGICISGTVRDHIGDRLPYALESLGDRTHMFVISSNTAFTYRNKPVETKQIGRELGVRYVLEGSVQRSRNRVRVTAQLINANTGAHLWADRFDRDIGDLLTLQDEVTRRLANSLGIELIDSEAARRADNPDTLDYILRGRAERLRPNSRKGYAQAVSLFEHALVLAPQSLEVQTQQASALVGRVLDGMTDSADADMARAEGPIEKARSALPAAPLVYIRLASAYTLRGEPERAVAELAEARRLGGEGSFPSIARVLAKGNWGVPRIRALFEATYFAGLRKAEVPKE